MLKHLPAKLLDTIKEMLLYDKEKVIIPEGRDRRSNMSNTRGDRTDQNLGSRITHFLKDFLKAMKRLTISQPRQMLKLYTMIRLAFLTNKFRWMKISRSIST